MSGSDNLDVAVIGAGISGINAGYRIQSGLPDCSYTIFEGRSELGGTWSLFKYPGIRSDSDLFTFGFPWDPWTEDRAIASADSILSYMKATAARHGIDKHIKFNSHVSNLDWKSDLQRWQITVNGDSEKRQVYHAKFVLMGTGYYDYNEPLISDIPNIKAFSGAVIHPQFWPENLDYTDKNVVIVGSGATAVTLLPAMAPLAKSITMLQRSPGYFFAPPLVEKINLNLKRYLPASWAHQLIRLRMMVLSYTFFTLCRLFPAMMRKALITGATKQLPPQLPTNPHFTPTYSPWQQRMCITPGGDFFSALRSGKATVATGAIETVTPTGITLKTTGQHIPADIIITATGLKINMGGHAAITVDNVPILPSDKFVWKGALLQDVPNFAFVFGYTNASWTLGADATAKLFVRLIQTVRDKGMTSVVPNVSREDAASMKEVPFLNLNSTYIKAAEKRRVLPKGGDRGPWVPRSSYFKDYWNAKFGDLKDGLSFKRVVVD